MEDLMRSKLQDDVLGMLEESYKLLEELCLIPAPSHEEDERALFVKKWLEDQGAQGVYIDEAKNVVFPYNCEGKGDLVCFEAHTDTVFPRETPLDFRRDEENFYCPGIGDDTVNLVVMLLCIKALLKRGLVPEKGILFVANSCEEGLGNLKGTRQIFQDFEGRISRFVTFDGTYRSVVCRAVGSHRYAVEVKTQGGHSWNNFGRCNALVELAKLVTKLAEIPLPEVEGAKTSFNVGVIEGGTSVNTIAQWGKFLYEYRSDNAACLDYMEKAFHKAVEEFRAQSEAEISVETVGLRPCGEARDRKVQEEMIARAIEVSEKHSALPCKPTAGSTDCNIPLSLGIPAICPGVYMGGGMHTREEYCNIKSISTGLAIGMDLIADYV